MWESKENLYFPFFLFSDTTGENRERKSFISIFFFLGHREIETIEYIYIHRESKK